MINFDEYIGKEFIYESKYGGTTKGIVKRINCNSTTTKLINDKLYTRPIIKVVSTNGALYDISEVMFIETNERVINIYKAFQKRLDEKHNVLKLSKS